MSSDFKLILEGTIPAGYPDARICVDNITSYTEPCSALEPKPVATASTLSWAHYFGLTFIAALVLGLTVPMLFLGIIILICRRRHQYRHANYTNSKLFSTNLWHYIGGKEVSEDPFAEHTASIHRPAFMSSKFSGDATLAMRTGDAMDLPDVVIPGGRVVSVGYNGGTLRSGGTLVRQQGGQFNGGCRPYGSATMMPGKNSLPQQGVAYPQSPIAQNMMISQPNFPTELSAQGTAVAQNYNIQNDIQQSQQQMNPTNGRQQIITGAPLNVSLSQAENFLQAAPGVIQPSNYFQSLSQPIDDQSSSYLQSKMPLNNAQCVSEISHNGVEDSLPFVLPDPPSDINNPGTSLSPMSCDHVAALEALNAATSIATSNVCQLNPPQNQPTSVSSPARPLVISSDPIYTGEHPPPGYDEAVGLVHQKTTAGFISNGVSDFLHQPAVRPVVPVHNSTVSAAAPILPPRRIGAGQCVGNSPTTETAGLSLAERYGLPVADI